MTSNYEAPRIYQVSEDINPENVIASSKPHALHDSLVEGSHKFHHNMGFPCSEKEKGIFNLVFPEMITSPINETTQKSDGVTKNYPIFAKVYGNYHEMVSTVNKQIDAILSDASCRDPEKASPQELEKIFCESLTKRGKSETLIGEELKTHVTDSGMEFGIELFRYLMLKVLIEDEKVKDVRGHRLEKAMIQLRKCYCDSMDKPENAELKKKILLGIGMKANELKTPTDQLVDSILEYEDYPATDLKLAGLVNYTKSPQIHFKLMVSVPKGEQKKNPIVLSSTGQILWASVYDFQRNPLGKTPITTYEQFNRFVYRAGDTKKGKNMFELLQSIISTAPSVYWEKGAKAIIQFKAVTLKIFDVYEIAGFTKTLSNDEYQKDLQGAREAMSYYKRESKPQTIEEPVIPDFVDLPDLPNEFQISTTGGEEKRDRDQDDIDAMISEGFELQERPYKKKKKSS